MAYQVLARKWRPRSFKEMVGQEHVLRALINALDNDRLHHAFLFTGTRGVGKTTISRILAKSLNCDQGVSSTPCGVCSSCTEIDEGRFVDLIEVDAASRTKVEDTRELLENVQYAPTRGRYKVYLIDEVHMLSNHSFNALLKTLEEPPPHVKFLLATTDPQKLPVTILSRCLQFSLRRLSHEAIAKHLQYILEQEDVPHQPGALKLIAHGADGSMRDGLSLLDQAIAYGGGQVQEDETRSMLGTIDRQYVFNLLKGLADENGIAVMNAVAQLAMQSPDYLAVCGEIISTLQRIAMLQMVPQAVSSEESHSSELSTLAQQMTPEAVQLYYQIALHMRRDLPLNPDSRGGLEMGLLRMLAFNPTNHPSPTTPSKPAQQNHSNAPTVNQQNPVAANPQNPAAEAFANIKKPAPQAEAKPVPPVQTPEVAATTSAPANHSNSAASLALAAARNALKGNPPFPKAQQQLAAEANTEAENRTAAEVVIKTPQPQAAPEPPKNPQASPVSKKAEQAIINNDWASIIDQLSIGGMTRQLAMHCTLQHQHNSEITLRLMPSHEQFLNREREQQLSQILSNYYNSEIQLKIEIGDSHVENPMQIHQRQVEERQQAAVHSILNDVNVQSMRQIFAAEVNLESIKPL